MTAAVLTRPARIKRERTPGWTVTAASTNPLGLVYIGRGPGDYGRWGNPFIIGQPFELPRQDRETLKGTVRDRRISLLLFGLYLNERPDLRDAARAELAGRDLMCWCRLDQLCHGDLWLHHANPRTHTPDVTHRDGSSTINMKRCCNNCGAYVGDVTDWELTCGAAGLPLPDVRHECPTCSPGTPA